LVTDSSSPSTGNTLDAFRTAAAKVPEPKSPNADSTPLAGKFKGVRKAHVQVGQAVDPPLVFNPAEIGNQSAGTVVEFSFNPKVGCSCFSLDAQADSTATIQNHSIVQSSFAKPCVPLDQNPFFSGFIPTAVSPSGAIFDIVIKDTKPLWFYCAQTKGDHCQSGMVGSVNA
jgi:hypothetical protein